MMANDRGMNFREQWHGTSLTNVLPIYLYGLMPGVTNTRNAAQIPCVYTEPTPRQELCFYHMTHQHIASAPANVVWSACIQLMADVNRGTTATGANGLVTMQPPESLARMGIVFNGVNLFRTLEPEYVGRVRVAEETLRALADSPYSTTIQEECVELQLQRNAARERLGIEDADEMTFYYRTPFGDTPTEPLPTEPNLIGYSGKKNVYYTRDYLPVKTKRSETITVED